MADVLIDTSAWIEASKYTGRDQFQERVAYLLRNNRAITTEPIILEILSGVNPDKRDFWKTRLKGIKFVNVQHKDWYTAASHAYTLRRKGLTVKNFDILIATVAIENDFELLHRDRDFDQIADHLPLQIFTHSVP